MTQFQCPWCGKTVGYTKKGNVRTHMQGNRSRCGGVGQPRSVVEALKRDAARTARTKTRKRKAAYDFDDERDIRRAIVRLVSAARDTGADPAYAAYLLIKAAQLIDAMCANQRGEFGLFEQAFDLAVADGQEIPSEQLN